MEIKSRFRKQFLKATSLTVGLAVAFALTLPGPSHGKRRLTILAEDHWAPTFNIELKRQVAEWAARCGVDARIDFISSRVAPPKIAVEAESKRGHDLLYMFRFDAALYKQNLCILDDIATKLEREYGPWRENGRYLYFLDGHWYAIPYFFYTWPANINVVHWKEIGFEPDQVGQLTCDGFLEAAKKLKTIGHPVASAIDMDFDASSFLYPLLWSFGGKTVDEQGNILVDSPETKAMFEYLKELHQYMPPEVTGWSGKDNNLYMQTGVGSWTVNCPTIYAVAKIKKLPIVSHLDHVPLPRGPAGRFVADWAISWGIWNFSPNIDLAKDLLTFLLQRENYSKQIAASWGCNQPYLEGFKDQPIWREEHALRYLEPLEQLGEVHPYAWPGPASPGACIEVDMGILGVACSKAVTGEVSIPEAIAWLKHRLMEIHRK